MSFQYIRRFFYEIHLWLGIAAGMILFVVCLSGTVYVFHEEVRHFAEPTKYYVDVPDGSEPLSVDELIARIETVERGMKVVSITIPEKSDRTVSMTTATASPGVGRARHLLYVDPYSGEIVGEGPNVVDPFFMSVARLHRFLWLPPRTGRLIVGIATVVFVVLCVSGLVLWLPRTWKSFGKWRAWKPGFKIRFRKGVWPFIYDIHNTVGFYLLIPSLILALTGLCWSFSWYRDGASHLLGDRIFKQQRRPKKIEPIEGPVAPLSVGEVIARQNRLTPRPGEISVSIPQDGETAMVVRKGCTGFFALAIKDKTQWDRFRGTVIPVEHHGKTVDVERFSDKPFGAQIAASIRAVHLGNVTGMSSKLFFFIACFFATSFPATGVALWVKKLRVKYKKRKKANETNDPSAISGQTKD